jgi:hypothetical protein
MDYKATDEQHTAYREKHKGHSGQNNVGDVFNKESGIKRINLSVCLDCVEVFIHYYVDAGAA